MLCHRKIFVSLLAAVAISSGDTGEAVQTSAVLRLRRQTASSERVPPDGRATIARLSMVPAAIPAASVSARVAADAPVAAMRPAAAGALSQRRSFVGARGVRDRRRRATRASTPVVRASLGGSISPDLNYTEEAFTVPLDRVAPGAFVSVSVRADATPEAAIDALVAVVRVHAPGEVQLQWGLGSENPDGSISRDPWECPPEALMPLGSYVVDSWATGSAVRTPLDAAGEVHIPLPSRPGHGLAFVLFDADKGCYYDDGTDRAFFLDSNASALAAGRATAAAIEAARAQANRVRDIARAEANAAAARETESARLRTLADVDRESEDEEREARRRKAVEEQSAYERMMADGFHPMANSVAAPATEPAPPPGFTPPGAPASTPYERYMKDPSNPFMNYTHAAPAAAAAAAVAAPPPTPAPAPPAPRADDFSPAFTAGGGGGGWASASSSAATASYTPPTPPARRARARARAPRGFRLGRRRCASHHLSDDGERFVHRLVRGGGDGDVAPDGASQLPGWRRGDGTAPAAALGRVRPSRRILAEPLRRVTERSSGFARARRAIVRVGARGRNPRRRIRARTRGRDVHDDAHPHGKLPGVAA